MRLLTEEIGLVKQHAKEKRKKREPREIKPTHKPGQHASSQSRHTGDRRSVRSKDKVS